MFEFTTEIDGIEITVEVTDYEPYRECRCYGLPEDCYPSLGGYGDWEVISNQSDEWVADHHEAINEAVFEYGEAWVKHQSQNDDRYF